jgi:hypothetical protein
VYTFRTEKEYDHKQIQEWANFSSNAYSDKSNVHVTVILVKDKVILVLNEAPYHEDNWNIGSIAPHIFNLDTRWRWTVKSTTGCTIPGENGSQYRLDRRLGGIQSESECCGE